MCYRIINNKKQQQERGKKMVRKKVYPVKDFDNGITIFECTRQKEILETLNELLENAQQFGLEYIFDDNSFYIEYADGSTYDISACGAYGRYKKRGIKRIIYNNANDTMVYGNYEINEYGCVS